MSDEWPKPWSEIREDNTSGLSSFANVHTEYNDGMRGMNGTLYVSESIGRETDENVDEWMPFEVYLTQKAEEQ